MARVEKTSVEAPDDGAATANGAAAALQPQDAFTTAHTVACRSCASARSMADWLAQMQAQQTRSLAAWRQALVTAQHEVETGKDLQALMSASARLANRQWALAFSQLAEAASVWMQGGVHLAEQLRADCSQAPWAMLPSIQAPAAAAAVDTSPLAQIGRMQEELLATTRRWVDAAAGTAAH